MCMYLCMLLCNYTRISPLCARSVVRTESPIARILQCFAEEKKEQILHEDISVGFEYDYLNLLISPAELCISLNFKLR